MLRIAKHKPLVLVENLAAKAATVTVLGLVLLFPSRRFFFGERHPLWLDAAFLSAIAVSSMNAILVAPKPAYLITFLCLTFLYTSIAFCRGLTEKVQASLNSA